MSVEAHQGAAWALAVAFTVTGCASDVTPVLGCEAQDRLVPDCRFHNPEDLGRLPGTGWLLVSQFGAMDGSAAGSIAAYEPATGRIEVLVPEGGFADDRSWGDATCPPPEVEWFSPHGIDVDLHPAGKPVLLVVNHGGRESVEFFEIEQPGDVPGLAWRGCAAGPEGAYFNDVVARSDGGFWVTQMMPKARQTLALLSGLVGRDTGFVYAWSAAGGFREVEGTAAPFPNGIEKSADERFLYVNSYLGNEVRKIDVATASVVARKEAASPDNLSWAEDGRLLVASHTDSIQELLACQNVTEGACGHAFEILALDPDTLEGFPWLAHRGAPMGGATVAVQMDDSLYLGSYAGDRITRWPIPQLEGDAGSGRP